MWHDKVAQCLNKLADLQATVLDNYIHIDSALNIYEYEEYLHRQSYAVLRLLKKSHTLTSNISDQLSRIHEIILSLGNLRFRIKDRSTFEICANEVKAISQALNSLLHKIAKQKESSADFKELTLAIQGFESIYQNTLQVVAADPLAFLFFIQDLFALQNELNLIQLAIMARGRAS